MIKCEVLVDRASLIVGKGSIVNVDEKQYELARQFLKPVETKQKAEKVEQKVEEAKVEEAKEEPKKDDKQAKKK